MRRFLRAAAVVLAVSAVGVVSVRAEEMNDEDYIKARIAQYREIGTSFKAISDQLKSGKPQAATIKTAAADIRAHAKGQYNWFRPGSGPESEEKTKAKPEIWAKPKDFRAAQDKFLAAATSFEAAANTTADPSTLTPQFKELGQACSSCHNTFRND